MSLTKVSYSMINGESVNVLDFGAIANGVTDASAAIQSALTYAKANSKSVFIPDGSYAMASGITNDGVRMFGNGNSILLWPASFSGTGITITGYGARIDELYVWHVNGSAPPAQPGIGIDVEQHNCILNRVNVQGVGSGAYQGWYNAIRFAEYYQQVKSCVAVGYANGITAENVNAITIDSSLIAGITNAGIFMTGGAGNAIVNCDIEADGLYGIQIYGTVNYQIQGLNISGNYIENRGSSPSTNISIAGYGSGLANSHNGISITGNYLALAGGGTNIIAGNTNGLSIKGNYCKASTTYSISLGTSNLEIDVNANALDNPMTISGAFTQTVRASVFTFPAISTGITWQVGTGTPEGAVTASVGSLFTRSNGGAGTTLYVKESGTGNTGWVAK